MAAQRVALKGASLRIHWPWLLVGIAWSGAIAAALTGQRALLDHHYLLEESGLSWPLAAGAFVAAWQVMIVAMMLPVSMPLVTRALATPLDIETGSMRHWRTVGALVTCFAIAWTLFGLLAFSGDTAIHRTVDTWPWLAQHTFVIGATTFALAGLFQFTRWKSGCLAICRSQRVSFAEPVALGGSSTWSWGARHGLASVGSCWALMLVMFGIGVGGLGWMLGLTGAMMAETCLPTERRARWIIGVALLALAALWLAHPAWLPVATS